jgi:hypothetical protein
MEWFLFFFLSLESFILIRRQLAKDRPALGFRGGELEDPLRKPGRETGKMAFITLYTGKTGGTGQEFCAGAPKVIVQSNESAGCGAVQMLRDYGG